MWRAMVTAQAVRLGAVSKAPKPQTARLGAGMPQIELPQDDMGGAQARVEAFLPILARHPRIGFNGSFSSKGTFIASSLPVPGCARPPFCNKAMKCCSNTPPI